VLAGLRASTYTSNANGKHDLTRGGTEFVVGSCATPGSLTCGAPSGTPTPSPTSTFQFNSVAYPVQEDCTFTTVTVTRVGVTTARATVDYTSVDGTARQKGDYIYATGRLVFEAGETQKSFPILINEDNYTEGPETATIVLSNPSAGTTLAAPTTACADCRRHNRTGH